MPFKDTSNLKTLFTIVLFFLSIISFGQSLGYPKIIRLTKKKTFKINTAHQIAWERQVRYLGVYKDTIKIDSANFRYSPTNPFITKSDLYKFYGKGNFLTTPLTLSLDTTQIISTSEFCYPNGDLKTKYFESFPVFIKNMTDSLASIGFGSKVNIIVEALDTDKVWKPIEKRYVYKCGNGLHYIYLKPGEICCALIPKYKGDFLTQLRLNINNSYSEPYFGHVSKSQFVD
ncbi:MAG: hypothetical protein ABJB11_12265 [Ferruginibacter sp.]